MALSKEARTSYMAEPFRDEEYASKEEIKDLERKPIRHSRSAEFKKRAVMLGAGVLSSVLGMASNMRRAEASDLYPKNSIVTTGEVPTLNNLDFSNNGLKNKEQKEQSNNVSTLPAFALTEKEKINLGSDAFAPETDSALQKGIDQLKAEYGLPEDLVGVEIAYSPDKLQATVYLRFLKDQTLKDANNAELKFTKGSILYSGSHYFIQSPEGKISAVIVDEKLKNFFDGVELVGGAKVKSPDLGTFTAVEQNAKNQVITFLTENLAINTADKDTVQATPDLVSTEPAPRAKMIEKVAPEGRPWEAAGVSEEVFMASYSELPSGIQERVSLPETDPRSVAFNKEKNGFVDKEGRVWRPGMSPRESGIYTDVEAGWLTETYDKSFTVNKNGKDISVRVILEMNIEKGVAMTRGSDRWHTVSLNNGFDPEMIEYMEKYAEEWWNGETIRLNPVSGIHEGRQPFGPKFVDYVYGEGGNTFLALARQELGQNEIQVRSYSKFPAVNVPMAYEIKDKVTAIGRSIVLATTPEYARDLEYPSPETIEKIKTITGKGSTNKAQASYVNLDKNPPAKK